MKNAEPEFCIFECYDESYDCFDRACHPANPTAIYSV